MYKKYMRPIIIVSCSLILIGAFFMFSKSTDNKQVVVELPPINDTSPPKKEELEDWKKEYAEKVLTEPAKKVVSKYGDFYYVPFPKQFPQNEIANLDLGQEITKDTKQVILKYFVYEKK